MKDFLKEKISRKHFLKRSFKILFLLSLFDFFSNLFFNKKVLAEKREKDLKEAMFYKKLDNNTIQCEVCFRGCILKDSQRSFCRNKINKAGRLYNLVYAKPSAIHIDPIEKEPALHMLPGSQILCFGTAGCNFRCKGCQNWHLSQRPIEEMEYTHDLSPEAAVKLAVKEKIPTLSFTYNEPTSFYEYVYDIAKIAKQKGLKVLWHSNGAMRQEPLKELLKFTDAVSIDLKGFTSRFYQTISGAELEPVLNTLKIIRQEGKWLEIVNLVIPSLNDNFGDIEMMCLWIKENLGENTPLHFSRFFPAYRLTNLPATPISTLEKAYEVAKTCGLNYVTVGNVPGHKNNSTFCPGCGRKIIHRLHFTVLSNDVVDGRCRFCEKEIPGIWS